MMSSSIVYFATIGKSCVVFVHSVLKLETSSTEADLQELLTGLTIRHLKDLSSEFQVKPAVLRPYWLTNVSLLECQNVSKSSTGRQISFTLTMDIKTITGWTKDLSLLRNFTFISATTLLTARRKSLITRIWKLSSLWKGINILQMVLLWTCLWLSMILSFQLSKMTRKTESRWTL